MIFANVYPPDLAKAEEKGRTKMTWAASLKRCYNDNYPPT